MVTVRNASPADATAIRDVHVASIELASDAYRDAVIEAWSHDRDPSSYPIDDDDAVLVVAEDEGRIVGFGELRPEAGEYLDADVDGEVRAMYVHPDAAGRGVGRAIYDELERRARARDVRSLGLWASLNAVGFYEHLGFERVGERMHEFGGEVPGAAMEMRTDLD